MTHPVQSVTRSSGLVRRISSDWRYVADSVSQTSPLVTKYYNGIVAGDRAALAKGITLVESANPRKKAMGRLLYFLTLIINHFVKYETKRDCE